ncbi:Ormdl2 protein [Capsaspora owczarzaki ATCC 30864]|uniref:Ormdl2 protein n=1 Tax=Capsaspora owczarzaki (strain ATCC 30864) TaxID=595528 RepID=A0A0D2WL25_CAPO3|nr:Ormdl2 protein [Capsaspora owczarzaki ATCC 30864]KJE91140.1 Ormdl2 protein [Capsaspora owczarzaki ATCC 30864]|eukprot:XP_004349070.1 Ormdl2 protein [Capsaspora owczarzaki ATCC 30864]
MSGDEASSYNNPNEVWLHGKGAWLAYILLLVVLRLAFASVPFLSVPVSFTLTNVVHNMLSFYLFHLMRGTPFVSADQGESARLTQWEQIDAGAQFTNTRKFLAAIPIVLFLLTSHYTEYDPVLFAINFVSLCIVMVAKLPQMHKVRLFWFFGRKFVDHEK